jgi:hypothetical protein
MNKNKLNYLLSLWVIFSILASYLKITHSFNQIAEILFILVFLLSLYLVFIFLKKV